MVEVKVSMATLFIKEKYVEKTHRSVQIEAIPGKCLFFVFLWLTSVVSHLKVEIQV